jgi:hypothetical protein
MSVRLGNEGLTIAALAMMAGLELFSDLVRSID